MSLIQSRSIPGHDGEGIEIKQFDPAWLEREDIRQELNELWLKHGVVVFRGISSAATHVALSECFGPCQMHPVRQTNTDSDHPELTNVQYAPGSENGSVYKINGVELGGWLPLHFDLVYVDKVNHGGLLRAITIPETKGGTLFLDKIRLYDTLPERLKARIEGLEVLYSFYVNLEDLKTQLDDVKLVRMGFKFRDIETRLHEFPRSIHPLVYAQPVTGRKMLNLSPWFADAIVGIETPEGDALLHELVAHVLGSKDVYTHVWQKNDLVLWDNWRVLHAAEGVPPECSRWMQRTTISGDYALGRLEAQKVASRELGMIDV
jgi:taurine dioxygenase